MIEVKQEIRGMMIVMKATQWRRRSYTGLILILGLGLLLWNKVFSDIIIRANPIEVVEIDKDQSYRATIPNDSTKLLEEKLINNDSYKGFVQGDSVVGNLKKSVFNSVSTPVSDQVMSLASASNDRVLVTYRSVGVPLSKSVASYLALLDKEGNLLNKVNIKNTNFHTETINIRNEGFINDGEAYESSVFKTLTTDGDDIFYATGTQGKFNGKIPDKLKIEVKSNNDILVSSEKINVDTSFERDSVGGYSDVYSVAYQISTTPSDKGVMTTTTRNLLAKNIPNAPTTKPYFNRIIQTIDSSSSDVRQIVEYKLDNISKDVDADSVDVNGQEIYRLLSGIYIDRVNIWTNIKGKSEMKALLVVVSPEGEILDTFEGGITTFPSIIADDAYFRAANKIYKVSGENGKISVAKEYADNTDVIFAPHKDQSNKDIKYVGVGRVGEIESKDIGFGLGFYVGYYDEKFSPIRLFKDFSIPSDRINSLSPVQFFAKDGYVALAGTQNSKYTDFTSNGLKPSPTGEFMEKTDDSTNDIFFGTFSMIPDFSPVINKSKDSINVNIADPVMKIEERDIDGLTPLDRWLITGVKNGTYSDLSAIKVHDEFDIGQIAQEQLNRKINRNPNFMDRPPAIDWAALGFDKTNTGPQLVTYFVSDSQKQTTSTSRWINAATDKTQEKDNYYLDGRNFAIPLTNIAELSSEKILKTKAQTKAWNGTNGTIDEEASQKTPIYSEKVTFTNPNQVKAIQEAKQVGAYPLDIDYKATESNQIANRIWVFVTDNNTVIDEKNDVVIYKENYNKVLYEAAKETKETILATSKVKVYQYQSPEMSTEVLTPLADASKPAGLDVVASDVQLIQGATLAKSYPNIKLTYTKEGKTTTAPITITLDSYESVVTVQFLNEVNTVLSGYTATVKKGISDLSQATMNLKTEQAVIQKLADVTAAGYEILNRPTNETNVVLKQPTVTIQYKLTGVLSMVSAPSEFDFGDLTYTARAQRVDDPSYINKLSVLDSRANRASGWMVTAEVKDVLKNKTSELPTALHYVVGKDEKVLSKAAQVIYSNSKGNQGVVNISDSWGKTAEADGLKLQIDSTDRLETGTYNGTILWKVMAGQP